MISFLKPSPFLYIGESLTPIWGVFYGFSARLKTLSANLKTFSAKLKTFAANLFLKFHSRVHNGRIAILHVPQSYSVIPSVLLD